MNKSPAFDIRPTTIAEVAHLFRDNHAYASTGKVCTYAFAVFEGEKPVAAYLWQPPPPGAAKGVCALIPAGVLSLSRMAALPHDQRTLKHVSKPLRHQMQRMIDRSRWPVLVTYSDQSVGHTGHVYKCSGWQMTVRNRVRTYTLDGARVSSYSNGKSVTPVGAVAGWAWIQRWEHWIEGSPESQEPALAHFDASWVREPIVGKKWRSGAQAYRYVRR